MIEEDEATDNDAEADSTPEDKAQPRHQLRFRYRRSSTGEIRRLCSSWYLFVGLIGEVGVRDEGYLTGTSCGRQEEPGQCVTNVLPVCTGAQNVDCAGEGCGELRSRRRGNVIGVSSGRGSQAGAQCWSWGCSFAGAPTNIDDEQKEKRRSRTRQPRRRGMTPGVARMNAVIIGWSLPRVAPRLVSRSTRAERPAPASRSTQSRLEATIQTASTPATTRPPAVRAGDVPSLSSIRSTRELGEEEDRLALIRG